MSGAEPGDDTVAMAAVRPEADPTMESTMRTTPRAAPPARVLRSSAFAVVCVLLSVSGHAVTAGHPVSLSTSTLATIFIAATTWSITDRRRGLFSITAGLLGGQALLHWWFTVDPGAGAHAHTGSAEHITETRSAPMLAAHVLAAALCGVWLWWGERTAFALAHTLYTRFVLPLLLLSPHPTTATAPPRARTVTTGERPRVHDALRHCVARRGPPPGAIPHRRVRLTAP